MVREYTEKLHREQFSTHPAVEIRLCRKASCDLLDTFPCGVDSFRSLAKTPPRKQLGFQNEAHCVPEENSCCVFLVLGSEEPFCVVYTDGTNTVTEWEKHLCLTSLQQWPNGLQDWEMLSWVCGGLCQGEKWQSWETILASLPNDITTQNSGCNNSMLNSVCWIWSVPVI